MQNNMYPCLWFNNNAKEAASFYTKAFTDTTITSDTPMVVLFQSAGQQFMCLNGGPYFTINPSISFYVVMDTEEEVNASWEQLCDNGKVLMPLDKYPWSERYGWVQDRFGVSWQLSMGKLEDVGQKITPSLMFTGNNKGKAEQAIEFYTSIFDHSSVVGIMRYEPGEPDVTGYIKHAQFKLNGHVFMVMDSSMDHQFNFNEGLSLVVECDTQEEIDYFWNKLTEDGSESQCGWLKDQYGVSWQIVPAILKKLMSDPQKSGRVMQAFMKMKKFDIETLINA